MIELEKLQQTAIIYLNNPPLNVLTLDMTHQLMELLEQIEMDDDIRAVIITGKGDKAFCAGADIKEFVKVRNQVVEKKLKNENKALQMIEDLSKPVIAAINGIALGGGCEIALACDFRIAANNVKVGLPEIKLGVFPGSGGIYRLPKIVGMSYAMELMCTGDFITADEAYKKGLFNRLTDPENVLEAAKEFAGKMAEQPKESLKAIKQGVRKSLEVTREEAIQYNLELSSRVFRTDDCSEGIAAFFEKRKPKFN